MATEAPIGTTWPDVAPNTLRKFSALSPQVQARAQAEIRGGQGVECTVTVMPEVVVVGHRQPQNIGCSTRLPNGQTVGQVVQNSIANIESAAGPYDTGAGEFGAFLATVGSNGPIDFKNNFRGAASPAFLGDAGNFAYGAIASGIGYPRSVAEFGAGVVYAIPKTVLNSHTHDPANVNNPWAEDNSAARSLPSGYATNGCTRGG